jgi:hypothetical protein
MDSLAILSKTPQGLEALDHRDHELPRSLRHALILVDGHLTVGELTQKGAIIPEFQDALRELVARGLVSWHGQNGSAWQTVPPPFGSAATEAGSALRNALTGVAGSILGVRSGKVVKKLQESGTSREELSAAVEACFKLIRLTIDESQAEEFRTAAKAVLSRGS